MRQPNFILFFFIYLCNPAIAHSKQPLNSVYLEGTNNKSALILCHGRGKYPTWKVVNPLRIAVNQQLGYHTLSLQMPNDEKDWQLYADDFQESYTIINNAIRFLKQEQGISSIYLMGHSMGSRMASAFISQYLNNNHDETIKGLIVAGCRNNGGTPLSCYENLESVKIPVLDIWGADNEKDSAAAMDRYAMQSAGYTQIKIPGANHKFINHEKEFISAVVTWLKLNQSITLKNKSEK